MAALLESVHRRREGLESERRLMVFHDIAK
jgi:hypothetical protein